jgi:hypothetical protein
VYQRIEEVFWKNYGNPYNEKSTTILLKYGRKRNVGSEIESLPSTYPPIFLYQCLFGGVAENLDVRDFIYFIRYYKITRLRDRQEMCNCLYCARYSNRYISWSQHKKQMQT